MSESVDLGCGEYTTAKRRVGRPETPLSVRFEAGYARGAADDCWIWHGTTDKDGYGITSYKRKNVRAHRVSWLINHGDIPTGMCVCHTCDTPSCVNPSHLFIGTIRENNHDRHAKQRSAAMERSGNSRFTVFFYCLSCLDPLTGYLGCASMGL